jgi:hypothetical protein
VEVERLSLLLEVALLLGLVVQAEPIAVQEEMFAFAIAPCLMR